MKKRKNYEGWFRKLIIAELILMTAFLLMPFEWHNSCTPSFFNPLGSYPVDNLCAQVFTETAFPGFYWISYIFILTSFVYLVYKMMRGKR